MDSPDSLLFLTYVQGTRTQNREYIAIELKGKKIHARWDIGGSFHYILVVLSFIFLKYGVWSRINIYLNLYLNLIFIFIEKLLA